MTRKKPSFHKSRLSQLDNDNGVNGSLIDAGGEQPCVARSAMYLWIAGVEVVVSNHCTLTSVCGRSRLYFTFMLSLAQDLVEFLSSEYHFPMLDRWP